MGEVKFNEKRRRREINMATCMGWASLQSAADPCVPALKKIYEQHGQPTSGKPLVEIFNLPLLLEEKSREAKLRNEAAKALYLCAGIFYPGGRRLTGNENWEKYQRAASTLVGEYVGQQLEPICARVAFAHRIAEISHVGIMQRPETEFVEIVYYGVDGERLMGERHWRGNLP
ncbi:MAG TPA: hypothetical protein VGK27_06780 [Candidatus Deferrimicrobiaceae bacterium]|jgi:hypothetical protein